MKVVIIFIMAMFFPGILHGATTYIDECTPSNVQSAHDSASDGDTIQLRCNTSGPGTWTSGVTITKAVTISGQGPSSTQITRGISDSTPIFLISPTSDKNIRITGIHFYTEQTSFQVAIGVSGNSYGLKNVRIDNNKFTNGDHNIRIYGYAYPLIDNNTFINTETPIHIKGDNESGWNRPIQPGSQNAVYIENNSFYIGDYPTCAADAVIYVDSQDGGSRQVIRWNNFTSECTYTNTETTPCSGSSCFAQITNDHGNAPWETGDRGVVMTEAYNNQITLYGSGQVFCARGGVQIIHSNTVNVGSGGLSRFLYIYEEDTGSSPYLQDQVTNSFIWNNTITGSYSSLIYNSDPTVVRENYEYFLAAPAASGQGYTKWGSVLPGDTGDKGGTNGEFVSGASAFYPYTIYTCPHPLTGLTGVCNASIAGTDGYNWQAQRRMNNINAIGVRFN